MRITSRRRWEPASGARETVSTPVSFRSAAIGPLSRSRRSEPTANDPALLQNGPAQGDEAGMVRNGRTHEADRLSFLDPLPEGLLQDRGAPETGRPADEPRGAEAAAPGAPPADLRQEHAAELGRLRGDRLVGREGIDIGGRAPDDPPGEGGIEGFPGGDPSLGIGGNPVETGGRTPRRSPAGSGEKGLPRRVAGGGRERQSRKSGRRASPSPIRKRSKKSARGSGFRVTAMPPRDDERVALAPRRRFEGNPRHLEHRQDVRDSRFRRRGRRPRCRNRQGAAAIRG